MKKILSIIVTYNGANYIKTCLSSIICDSDFSDVICIDNNSSDQTVEIIKDNFPKVILIKNDKNLGFGKANNLGIKYAIESNYEFVFLLNQDTWIEKDTFIKLQNIYESQVNFGILSPLHLDGSGKNLDWNFEYGLRLQTNTRFISQFFLKKFKKSQVFPVGFVNAAAWFISIETIQKIGLFNPMFNHYGEDNDYVIRLHYHGLSCFLFPESRIYHNCPQQERRMYIGAISNSKRIFADRLIILCDIRKSFLFALREIFILSISQLIRSIFPFSSKNLFIEITIIYYFFRDLSRILKSRKEAKKNGAFLNL